MAVGRCDMLRAFHGRCPAIDTALRHNGAAMSTTLAVANQKGGVAKTTTVASLGAALAEQGGRVLLVDLDPQACLTFSLGIDPEDLELSVHHVLTKGVDPTEVLVTTEDGVDLLPATIELARAEADLLTRTGREYVIRAFARGARRVRLGPARLPALARCPHRRGPHRRRRRADPVAVRDAVAPRRRPAARHRPRRPPLHQPRPRGVGRAARRCTTGAPTTPGRARQHLRDLRARRDRAADPEVDPLRRGTGGRPVDPAHRPRATAVPTPTARSPRRSSDAGAGHVHERDPAPTSDRATAASRRSAPPSWSPLVTLLGGTRGPAVRWQPVVRRDARHRVGTGSGTRRHGRHRGARGRVHAGNDGDAGNAGGAGDAATGRPQADPTPEAQTTADGEPAVPDDSGERPAGRLLHQPAAGLAGRGRRVRGAHVPRLGQRDRQPQARGLPGLLDAHRTPPGSTTPGRCTTWSGSRTARTPRSASTTSPSRTATWCRPASELGTPLSHGCIRQWRPDAKALWDFAPVGTEVVVVA